MEDTKGLDEFTGWSAKKERAFQMDHAQMSVLPVRFGLLILAVYEVMVALPVVFNKDAPPMGWDDWLLRSVPLILHLGVFTATFLPSYARFQQTLVRIWAMGYLADMLYVVWPVADRTPFLEPLVVGMLATYALVRLRFVAACLFSWTAVAAFIAGLLAVRHFDASVRQSVVTLLVYNLFGTAISYQLESTAKRVFLLKSDLQREKERSEGLLHNILPASIAQRLKDGERVISDRKTEVTVLFADLVGFTPIASANTPEDVVRLLNLAFSAFDELAQKHGMEKIKTIGDAYMAVAGLPEPCADHAATAIRMGLEMVRVLEKISDDIGVDLRIRVGIHSGPVVAGVIGSWKYSYDLWGDTVNVASRLEANGIPNRVQVSERVALATQDQFVYEPIRTIELKGIGRYHVATVLGEHAAKG